MMRLKKASCILLALLMLAAMLAGCSNNEAEGALEANTEKGNQQAVVNANEENIDEDNLQKLIAELILPKYSGRKAGTEGNLLSAEYIADYFKQIGLENPKGLDNYLHYYEQPVVNLTSEPFLQLLDNDGKVVADFEHAQNFALRSLDDSTTNININAPLYVVNKKADLSKDNKELKGKVILLSLEARGLIPMYELIQTMDDLGVAAAIAEYDVNSTNRRNAWLTMTPLIGPWLFTRGQHNPFINVDNNTFAELLKAAENGNKLSFKCDYTVEYNKKIPNVMGMITGSDEKLKDEYIIVGGHFDHVGDNMNGTYNPGALDNASGTVAMMEVARVLKQSKIAPKKTILFMAFNGEEGGLIGSSKYASDPIYPLEKAVMINLDMVGSSAELPLSIMSPPGQKAELRNELIQMAKEINIEAESGIGGGSDHASFGEYGVPSVLLIHQDFINGYHSPNDTIEDIDKLRLEQVVKLVLHYIDKKAY